jgi:hypothetical protein
VKAGFEPALLVARLRHAGRIFPPRLRVDTNSLIFRSSSLGDEHCASDAALPDQLGSGVAGNPWLGHDSEVTQLQTLRLRPICVHRVRGTSCQGNSWGCQQRSPTSLCTATDASRIGRPIHDEVIIESMVRTGRQDLSRWCLQGSTRRRTKSMTRSYSELEQTQSDHFSEEQWLTPRR